LELSNITMSFSFFVNKQFRVGVIIFGLIWFL